MRRGGFVIIVEATEMTNGRHHQLNRQQRRRTGNHEGGARIGRHDPHRVKTMASSTEELYLPEVPGSSRAPHSGADRYARLLQEAARHIEELERGLMSLARLPVQAHAARLGLLHELLSRCGKGVAAELKVASALRQAGLRQITPEPDAMTD